MHFKEEERCLLPLRNVTLYKPQYLNDSKWNGSSICTEIIIQYLYNIEMILNLLTDDIQLKVACKTFTNTSLAIVQFIVQIEMKNDFDRKIYVIY